MDGKAGPFEVTEGLGPKKASSSPGGVERGGRVGLVRRVPPIGDALRDDIGETLAGGVVVVMSDDAVVAVERRDGPSNEKPSNMMDNDVQQRSKKKVKR
ncbi:MAG: hypothetical protein M1835_007055 [Candelina submexicana]|nr:MAG: hypothetical protein M1835_007055 [Candelina submexicana]